jgi:hypothetical protein
MTTHNLKPVVIYITDEERDALDKMVEERKILHADDSTPISRTSVARELLLNGIRPKRVIE